MAAFFRRRKVPALFGVRQWKLGCLAMRHRTISSSTRATGINVSNSFDEILQRLNANDQDAATELWQRFAPHLNRLAQKRLSARLKNDSEDAVQSAFRSFFTGLRGHEFQLEDWDSTAGLLARITLRKCIRRIEYNTAAKRDIAREVSTDREDSGDDFIASLPGGLAPHVEICLQETLAAVIEGLTEQQMEILTLNLQQMPTNEIASHVGRTERTVQRVLKQIQVRLENVWTGGE